MTTGTLILLLIAGWLVVVWYAGKFAVRATEKRWARWPAMLVTLWLPLWDVIPGVIMYRKAVQEVGGVRVYRTVQANGYLDLTNNDCRNCWPRLANPTHPYQYVEIKITVPDPLPGMLAATPGYYTFEFAPADSAECTSLENVPGAESMRRSLPAGRCLVVTRRDAPISRYEYETSRQGWQRLAQSEWFCAVEVFRERVRDRQTESVVAEANSIRFVSWLGRRILVPRWTHINTRDGMPIRLSLTEVIHPIGPE